MHASLKLIPGVNVTRTPALNEAGISSCSLIRFMSDPASGGLPQKLGGWSKYLGTSVGSIVRQLWAWANVDTTAWLAVGAESKLGVAQENSGALIDITPRFAVDNVATAVTTVSGSSTVKIKDVGSNITVYDSVWIQTHIAVGGLILYGVYQCSALDSDHYNITATDVLGNPQNATANVTDGGSLEAFTTVNGSSFVTVTLTGHGLVVGSIYPILVSTAIGGVTLLGNYTVTSVVDPNNFQIQAAAAATSGVGPTSINSGNARYHYFIGQGPLPTGSGFGVGPFGAGGFGSGVAPSSNPGAPITTTDWTLDNYGGLLVACPVNGAIYVWSPSVPGETASVIPTAPPVNEGVFVAMPQRQIIAWGSTNNGIQDPLLIRWCDVNNAGQWIPLVQNQAGSFRLTRGSRIVTAIPVALQSLIWTDIGLWSMQYVGQPDVYSFTKIGQGCGAIGAKCAGFLGDTAYWMSQNQFFAYGGSGVDSIPCPIWDVVYQNLDLDNVDKIRFAANSYFNEVVWYIPVKGGGLLPADNGENSMYVKFNPLLGAWDYGLLPRSAWVNQSVLGAPIGADPTNNFVYQHEVSNDADGMPMTSYFQTGYFVLSEGDVKSFIDQVWPDMKWGLYNQPDTANVQITFYVADYPGDTPSVFGPFTVTKSTQFITPRFRGRLVSIRVGSSDIGSFWRLGNIRYRFQPDGKFY